MKKAKLYIKIRTDILVICESKYEAQPLRNFPFEND